MTFGVTNTMKNKELTVMRQLRANARETLTKMSRKTGIPVSTIYEWLRTFEQGVITKHTCLLNFAKLGYDLRVTMLLKTDSDKKDGVQSLLRTHHRVNTLLKINNGFDFFCEVLFKSMNELQEFVENLEKAGVIARQEFYVLEEVCREVFLSSSEHTDLVCNEQ